MWPTAPHVPTSTCPRRAADARRGRSAVHPTLPDGTTAHPASFRDPRGRVVEHDGRVLRLLDEEGAADWWALRGSQVYADRERRGSIVRTWELARDAWPDALGPEVHVVLEHERLPTVAPPL
ncbi:hypothetical protein B7486_62850, partial [cyanobacterium TDX16]